MSTYVQRAVDAMSQNERRRLAAVLGSAETPLLRDLARDLHVAIARHDAVIAEMETAHARALAEKTNRAEAEFPLPAYPKGN
ncbi:hypothetical protein [Kitasatospora sp. NPDC001175]|uniref:hypothetical protein n=1 Tax=Kitasatospora sp. NPDC001175 TaxID=3157103 RepID=UPI003D0899C2